MQITSALSDSSLLGELGRRLARRRIDLELTQAELAKQAGVAKRTVERIEAGGSSQLSTVIRILRILELLGNLDVAIPEPRPSPLEALKMKGKQRKRAPKKPRADEAREVEWTWGDES